MSKIPQEESCTCFSLGLGWSSSEEAAPANPLLLALCGNDRGNIFVVVNVMHSQIPLCLQ